MFCCLLFIKFFSFFSFHFGLFIIHPRRKTEEEDGRRNLMGVGEDVWRRFFIFLGILMCGERKWQRFVGIFTCWNALKGIESISWSFSLGELSEMPWKHNQDLWEDFGVNFLPKVAQGTATSSIGKAIGSIFNVILARCAISGKFLIQFFL